MKKLFLCLPLAVTAVALTGCAETDNGNEVLKAKFAEEITAKLEEANLISKKFDTAAEYSAEYSDDLKQAYGTYLGEHVFIPSLINEFSSSLVDADVTLAQLTSVISAIDDVNNAGEDFDLNILLIETLLDVKLSSDQLINTVYNFVQDLDDTVIDVLDNNDEKTQFAEVHDEVIEGFESFFEDSTYSILFDLTEEQRENDLFLCKFTFGNVLDYTYSLESLYNNLKAQFDTAASMGELLTQANFTAIVEANKLAFDASFGNDTEADYLKVVELMIELNDSLYGDVITEDTEEEMTAEEIANLMFVTKEVIGTVFDNLAAAGNQEALYKSVLGMVGSDDGYSEETAFNNFVIFGAIVIVDAVEILGDDLKALVEDVLDLENVELVSNINFVTNTTIENLTDAESAAIELLYDEIMVIIGNFAGGDEDLNPEFEV